MSIICIQAINVHCTVDLCYWVEWSQSERLIGTKVSEKTQNVPKNFAHSKVCSEGSYVGDGIFWNFENWSNFYLDTRH